MEAGQRVRVAVRVRPPLENDSGRDQCLHCQSDGRSLTLDLEQAGTGFGPMRGVRSFEFDRVCGPETSQEQFFSPSVRSRPT